MLEYVDWTKIHVKYYDIYVKYYQNQIPWKRLQKVLKERRLSLQLKIYVTFNERIILQNNYSSVTSDIILMQKIISGKGKRGLTRMSLYIVRVVAVGLVIKVKSISWLKIKLLYYRLMSNMHMERTKWIPGVSIGCISVARVWLCSPL